MIQKNQKVHESKTSQTRSLSRLVSLSNQSKGNLYLTVISAPDAEAREKVSHHLRYWPYVKFFKYQGDRHLLVCFCLGEAKDGYQLKQLFERSRQLILLCLRQYDVTITRWKPLPEDFKLFRNRPLFTRPDSTLRPFITYMGDSIPEESSKGTSGAKETSGAMIIPHLSSLKKEKSLTRVNIITWVKTLFPKLSSLRTLGSLTLSGAWG